MRSFIKSHKKTDSLDESPIGFVAPYSNDNEELVVPHIPKDDPLSFLQSTPPQVGSNFQGFKHSPGFESFHKLNKKMFPGKLFKKNSSSDSPLQRPANRFEHKEYRSAPGTPQNKKHDISNYVGQGRNSHDDSRFLMVKGTVTHAWGDNGDNDEQQVIVLNANNGSNQTRAQSPVQSSTSFLPFDLGPAVRISSMAKSQEPCSKNLQTWEHTPRSPTEQYALRQDEDQQQPTCSRLSRVKNKNRQARIHSNDDILNLGKDSSVTMDFLNSAFSPASLNEDPSGIRNFNNNNGNAVESATKISNTPTVKATDTREDLIYRSDHSDIQIDGDTTVYLTPAEDEEYENENEEYEEDDEQDEEDEGDDDAISKFSFELNPINGRTSSVKYYSKPQPPEVKYIDDLYQDENFDEDMHCLEDDDDEVDFPSNNLDISDGSDTGSVITRSLGGPSNCNRQESKPVKKYQDLFDLSDEEIEGDNFNTKSSGLVGLGFDGLGFDEETIGDSNESSGPKNEKKPFDSECLPSKQMKVIESGLEKNTTNFHERASATLNEETAIRSPATLQSSTMVNSPLSVEASPSMSPSAFRLQSPSTIVPAENKSSMIDHSDLLTCSTGAYSGKQKSLTKNKVIKNFSDIFDVDSSLSDEIEDQAESTTEDCAVANEKWRPPECDFLNSLDDVQQKKNHRIPISPSGKPKTPIQIYLTPPDNVYPPSDASFDGQLHPFISTPSLPPPARSQGLKYHDLSSNLDSEIPGMMSNLYFIDETEEDKYIEEHKLADEDYLDEINTVPEDFNFSDPEHEGDPTKSFLKHSLKSSFRGTHSYSSQPTGAAREHLPTRNKLEIKNKTVTFFNHSWDRSPTERFQKSPSTIEQYSFDDFITPPPSRTDLGFTPITPSSSTNQLSPGFMADKSLSPIQEGSSSVDNSPRAHHC